jgi:hypothetical protein
LGNFDVKLLSTKNYTCGTGYLQNQNEIGYNYQDEGVKVEIPKKNKKNANMAFCCTNGYMILLGCRQNYLHDKLTINNGTTIHFLYKTI